MNDEPESECYGVQFMENARKKSKKNLAYGLIGQAVTMLFGLIVPRLVLLNYGSEANGLVSSVAQIFIYVSLLELGVGDAARNALYGPIGAQDYALASGILTAADRYYKKSGVIYVLAVVTLAVVYPLLVPTGLSYLTVFGVVIFNGMGGAVRFIVSTKYYLLLRADGYNYVEKNLDIFTHLLLNIAKIVLIYCGFGIVMLQVAYFVLNIGCAVFTVFYVRRHYAWIDLSTKPIYSAISQKNSVLVHNFSALVFFNTDQIILTFFCGLKVVSVYSLITTLITCVSGVLTSFSESILFALGQNFQNDRGKFNDLYDLFEWAYYALVSFCTIMVYLFLNPFLSLYTKNVSDIQYVDPLLPILFSASYFLSWSRVAQTYSILYCAGQFEQTKKQAALEAAINLAVSLIAVAYLGIYGVLIGTIVALLYRLNEMIIYAARNVFLCRPLKTYRRLIINILWILAACTVGRWLQPEMSNYVELFGFAVLFAAVVALGTMLINGLTDMKMVQRIRKLVLNS